MKKKILIGFALLIFLLVCCNLASAFPPDGVAYYAFEENLLDTGSDGNSMNLNGTYDRINVTGKLGAAIDFNGSGDYVENSSLSGTIMNSIRTIDFWFKPNVVAGEDTVLFFNAGGVDLDNYMIFQLENDGTTKIYLEIGDVGKFDNYTTWKPDVGSWYHIVLVMGGAGMRLYVNGTLQATDDMATDVMTTDFTQIQIAKLTDGEPRYYNGTIDNLFMTASNYTQADVTASYNSGSGYNFTPPPAAPAPPTVILNSPANNQINVTTLTQSFVFTPIVEAGAFGNCSLYHNETAWQIEVTNTTTLTNNSVNTLSDTFSADGDYLWNVECCNTGGNCSTNSTNRTLYLELMTVTLHTPEDDRYNNSLNINFNCSATTPNDLVNISLYGNFTGSWDLNQTQVVSGTSNNATFPNTLKEEDYLWNCLAYDNESNSVWGTDNFTVHIDVTAPTLISTDPIKDKQYYSYNTSFNISINYSTSDAHNDTCWWNYDDGANTTFDTCTNSSYLFPAGYHNITLYANDSASNLASNLTYFYVNYMNITEGSYLSTTTETQVLNFTLLITTTNASCVKNANFTYNNTLYNYSNKTVAGNLTTFRINVTVPYVSQDNENITFWWNYSIDGITNFTTPRNQTVNMFNLIVVGADPLYNISALNFSFFDEGNQSPVNVSVDIDFTYWLHTRNNNRTYSYTNGTFNNLSFAIYPSEETIYADYDIDFYADGYPQRRYYYSDDILTNITSTQNFYLLKTADGMYVRFKTVDQYENAITIVKVTVEKQIGGAYTTIEISYTDDSGLATFWVNPDDDYRFTFTKTGYETITKILRPTSTEIYSVIMAGEADEDELPSWTGIGYTFSPSMQVLNNDTKYNFTFKLRSTYWAVSSCIFWIEDNASTTLNSTTVPACVSGGGNYSFMYNTDNLTSITAFANFTINNSISSILTLRHDYSVVYQYQGTFSLMNVFDDLKAFSAAGFNDFSRALIGFVVIFILVAVAAFYSGQYNPEGLLLLAMGLTWIFSYVEWFSMTESGIPFAFLEQYLIAIIITLLTTTFIIWRRM